RQWWQQEPRFNIGLSTGTASGVFAIDVDNDGDRNGEAELRRLEQEHGTLPATVEVITAHGRHIYFKMPETSLRCSAGRIAPGIDVRADGGYTVVPPSTHPSGYTYRWSVDSAKSFAAAPDWLIAKIAEPVKGAATPVAAWRSLVVNGVAEGQRDCTVTRLAGLLLRRFVDPIVTLELM